MGPAAIIIIIIIIIFIFHIFNNNNNTLKGIVNLMASGKVPVPVATFLAGGRLIALNKGKEVTHQMLGRLQWGKHCVG